jgi:hypothetical protein
MTVTYDSISTTTLGSDQGSITISSIPATYTDLVLMCFTKDTRVVNGVCDFSVRINGITNSTYNQGTINNASGFTLVSATVWAMAHPGSSNNFSPNKIYFSDYRNTNNLRNFMCRTESMYSSDGNDRLTTGYNSSASAAITSITIIGEQGIKAGSIFALYGITTE